MSKKIAIISYFIVLIISNYSCNNSDIQSNKKDRDCNKCPLEDVVHEIIDSTTSRHSDSLEWEANGKIDTRIKEIVNGELSATVKSNSSDSQTKTVVTKILNEFRFKFLKLLGLQNFIKKNEYKANLLFYVLPFCEWQLLYI